MRSHAMMPRACGAFLCLMALAVAVAASNHPRNSRKSREALLGEDAILEKAALRTGESPREILRLLGRLAARRNGSPEAGLPRPLEDPDDLAFMERRLGGTGGRVDGGMQPQGRSQVESPHYKDGGRLHRAGRRHDLDRLLRLSGFPAITKSGRRDHEDSKLGGSGLSEEEAILGFLEEVVAHRGSRERRTTVVGENEKRSSSSSSSSSHSSSSSSSFSSSSSSSSALLPTPGPSPTPSPTPFPTPSRTMVKTCGSCTWYMDTNGTLNIEGPEDCGSTCTATELSFWTTWIQSIGRGAFNRTGLSHVTELSLHYNQISSLEAGAFAGLGNLEELSLYGNQISSLEAGAFAGLGNLEELGLAGNQISSLEAGAFAGLGNLSSLSLGYNQISSLEAGAFAGLGNLEHLDLDDNQISSLEAGAFAGLGNLTYLGLEYNQISSLEAGAFAGLGNLERLHLYGNPLVCKVSLPPSLTDTQLPSGYDSLPDCIPLPHGSTAVQACGSCWWYRDTNGTLNILGPEDCGSTCTATELSFDDMWIQSIGRGAFNRTGLSHVTMLWLGWNQISSWEAGAFAGLGNLEELDLGGNQISSLEAGAFADLGNLTSLYLGDNGISSWNAGAFADLGNLKELWLHYNQISSLEAGAFAGLGNLERLSLGDNQISSLEAGAFAGLGNLEHLWLASNQISSLEAGAFADLGNLKELGLEYNQISSLEAGAFADLGNLEELHLYGNPLACKVLLPPSLTSTWLPSGYDSLPDCTTSQTSSSSSHSSSSSSSHSSSSSSSSPAPPSTSLLPPWLADVAASGRFSDPSCTETRSMFDLVKLLRSDPGLYVSGGLRGLRTDVFGIWACIANHPCLLAVGAGSEDRMCYAVEHKANKHTVLHAWGLGSELNMVSESCASNAQQANARRGIRS